MLVCNKLPETLESKSAYLWGKITTVQCALKNMYVLKSDVYLKTRLYGTTLYNYNYQNKTYLSLLGKVEIGTAGRSSNSEPEEISSGSAVR